jgi:uncharacterized protein YndB with AHSA1/START domain
MAKTEASLIEARVIVQAPPNIVYVVLTSPADMVGWLANEARCEAHAGSIYELRWNTGYFVHGEVLAAEKAKLLTVLWQAKGAPAATKVSFALAPRGDGTEVVVRHSGFGRGAKWAPVRDESSKGWVRSLECLKHLIETGVDLREAQRPMMGVFLDKALDPEEYAQKGIDTKSGVYLSGVVDGLSAQAAGLRAHDVIVAVDGKPVDGYLPLTNALQGRVAGDRVELAYVRGMEHKSVTLELKPRPIPDIPFDHKALLALLLERYEKARTDLVKAVSGATEAQAEHVPAEGEWSAKDTIAHLCVTERALHCALGDLLVGDDPADGSGNPTVTPEALAAARAGAPSLKGLLNRLAHDQAETLAIVGAMRPEIVANRARYRRIGRTVYEYADHTGEHTEQVKAALAAAK